MSLLALAATVLLIIADPRIAESSSLVSTPSGSWLWTANDSGDSARLFAVGPDGRTLAVVTLPRTPLRDLEDMALGPDRTLYLADVGDNNAVRDSVTVLRVPEPRVDPARTDVRLTSAAPVRTVLTYEDGPRDAETLLVHPRTGQLLVVTKSAFGSAVYAAPQPLADGVLRRVGSVALRQTDTEGGPSPQFAARLLATGGAVSPDGRRLVVRTYTDAYVFDVPGDDLAAAFRNRPTVLPLPATRQGEAVTWSRDGQSLLTSSEGRRAPVHLVPAPAAAAPPQAPPAADARPADPTSGAARLVVGAVVAGGALVLLLGVAALRRARR
ncbi:MAG TPA: hypothetical protein VFR07_06725 [Mycobacteriales bacterium]|nr:hypothetical protein [Mycobacteriales bacterium]